MPPCIEFAAHHHIRAEHPPKNIFEKDTCQIAGA